ncbi:thiol reductant ABC exporter subunit CydD [Phaeovibrio sulfidiphilus]|uniref:Thiol reductant ABC exporter subunit CydD n=1 Tax=Phaeovibrio sulfidiphilus TaxID=1220600 RepID=A0A8J6YN81_9PROT|nr:thiol reductant ABC exporter subunit CydD [Phaeovibrio sulfidiphilus]MBE1236431.1 thiol reductant ABC exporter subunit CydD [Phaeovibrio sulfidiphilus]
MRGLRPSLLGLAGLSLASGVLLIVLAWLLADTLNALAFENTLPDGHRLALVAALILGRFVVSGIEARISAGLGIRAGLVLRRLFVQAQLHGTGRRSTSAGAAALLLVEGIEAVEPFFARFLPAMIQAAFLPVAILVVAFPLDYISALTLALTAPLIPVFMVLIGKGAVSLNVRQWEAMNRLSAYFLDAVRALTLFRTFNALDRECERLAEASDEWRSDAFDVLRIAFLSSLALEFFATLGVALVAVFIGFRLLSGDMDYTRGLFLLVLAPEFYRPLRMMGVHYHARMESTAAAGRLAPLMGADDAPAASPPASGVAAPSPVPGSGGAPAVRFDAVTFAYDTGGPVLRDLTLELEPGTLTALVGASGVGKTTVLDLARGALRPGSGRVLVGGAAPDLSVFRPCWVPQDPHPFAGTVRDAVALGRPDASDAEILAALEQAAALDIVAERFRGLDRVIGEGGQGLSGGEIRRLSLARAFLADASLVLLDEPSASLDQDSETALAHALGGLVPRRTVLVAAHRLATIRAASRILVLEDGRIVEDGPFEALRDAGGAFTRLLGSRSPLVAAALNREKTS